MEIPPKSLYKYSYKIINWKDYNNALKKRDKVSLWLSAKLLSIWAIFAALLLRLWKAFKEEMAKIID
jgi:hypothetical protein